MAKNLEDFLKKGTENNKREELISSFLKAHNYIQKSHHVSHPNFDLGECGQSNDVVTMSLANTILGRNLLVKGNYGLGKTTSAQAVSALAYQLPIEFVEQAMLQGNPFLTEEKIFGRFDFSKLNEEEKVIFSLFSQVPASKIVDEVNRIPPQTQNSLLKAVETGQFGYMDQVVKSNIGKLPFFATANYEDMGNTSMSPPFLDRFDASVEVQQPLFFGDYLRGETTLATLTNEQKEMVSKINKTTINLIENNPAKANEITKEAEEYISKVVSVPSINYQKERLSNKELTDNLYDIFMNKKIDYKTKLEEANKIKQQYEEQIKDISLNGNISALKNISKAYSFSEEGQLFWNSFIDHVNSVPKIQNEQVTNNHEQYPVGQIQNELSVRLNMRGKEFAGLISYLKGESEISVETIEQTLPYLISHRANFSDELEADSSDTNNSLSMRNARQVVKNFKEDVFQPNLEDLKEMYGSLGSWDKIKAVSKKYADHTEPSVKEFSKRFAKYKS